MDETRQELMTATHDEELYITLARHAKVRKLIAALDVLTDHDWDTSIVLAGRMDDVQWEGLALRAGVNPPSSITREMVIEGLRERLRIRHKVEGQRWFS